MERWKITIGTLFLATLLGACNLSSEIQPGTPLPPGPAAVGTTAAPAETQVEQTAAPKGPSPAVPTPSSTLLITPSPTWTWSPTGIPTETPLSTEAPDPERLVFGPGEVSAVRAGQISSGKEYSIYALEGQVMRVVVRSEVGNPVLEITDPDGNALTGIDPEWPFWRGFLPASGDYRLQVIPDISPIDFELSVLIVPPGEKSWWTAYRDEMNGFVLEYSDYFGVGRTYKIDGRLETTDVLTLVFVGSEYFETTNLREADLVVNVSQNPEIVGRCLEPAPYEESLGKLILDGVPFLGIRYGDAGAGSFYEVQIYRAVHEGTCYEILFFIHSFDTGVYGPDTKVQEYDHAGALAHLREVLLTFRFIP